MSKEQRPLLMRANRLLGASLVEHNLVKIEDLETAFSSPRDKQPYVIAPPPAEAGRSASILAYEKTGVDGANVDMSVISERRTKWILPSQSIQVGADSYRGLGASLARFQMLPANARIKDDYQQRSDAAAWPKAPGAAVVPDGQREQQHQHPGNHREYCQGHEGPFRSSQIRCK